MSLQSKEPSVNMTKLIEADPNNIRYFDSITEEFATKAVKIKGSSIQYIKNPSEAVQYLAIQQDPRAIQYIKNPSAQIQFEAVCKDDFAIDCIPKSQRLVSVEPVTGKWVIIPNKITPGVLRQWIFNELETIDKIDLTKTVLYHMRNRIIEKLTEFQNQENENK